MVLQKIALFLVTSLFSLYIVIVMLRFLLATARANFYNPLSQFLVKSTNPLLIPLRRMIPPIGKIDTASLVLAFLLQLIQIVLIVLILQANPSWAYILIAAIVELTRLVIWIFIIALIIQAILSWVGTSYTSPITPLLDDLTAPILSPLRRIIPTVGMIDLSPLAAILLLQVILIALSALPSIS